MCIPEFCIRGIPHSEFINDDGTVGSHLFNFKVEDTRDDGWIEQSINWEDNDEVVQFTFKQTKDNGTIQFRAGVVRLRKAEIDRLNLRPTIRGILSYERQILDNNPYHGNILLDSNVSKPTRRMIAANLALSIDEIILQE